MNAKINALTAEMDAKMSARKTRLVRWVVGIGIGPQITTAAILLSRTFYLLNSFPSFLHIFLRE